MDWIIELFTNNESVAHIVLLYTGVIVIGVLSGKVKIDGTFLDVTFALFAGIVTGHIRFIAPVSLLTFIRDFGPILFVFCIGLQVGPGFFESFKRGGVTLNMLTTTAILLNIAVMFACYFIFFDTSDVTNLPMIIGTLYDTATDTPGLGAANEALTSVFMNGNVPQIASGYTCTYPLGVLGIIAVTITTRFICKINLNEEEDRSIQTEEDNTSVKSCQIRLSVDNTYIEGRSLHEISEFLNREFICSRLKHDDIIQIPNDETVVHKGDEVLIVYARADTEIIKSFGHAAELPRIGGEEKQPMISKRVVITSPPINRKVLGKMRFSSVYGVSITKITRQGIDLFATHDLHLHVGDHIMVVGHEESVNHIKRMMGNFMRRFNAPNIVTILIGIFIGIFFGSFPIAIPGMPVPMELGLAGGPLIIAILIGRYDYRMKLVTYTTTSASMMLREIGLVLLLASVGTKAGDGLVNTVTQSDGLKYVYTGILITVIPILIIGTITRLKFKFNCFIITGMVAGTYTDPPALVHADQVCSHDAPSTGYSIVYPLSMFLRIFTAQPIVLFCCG